VSWRHIRFQFSGGGVVLERRARFRLRRPGGLGNRSEKTPLTALATQAIVRGARCGAFGDAPAGLAGVLIGGRDVGEALVEDAALPSSSATGSTAMPRSRPAARLPVSPARSSARWQQRRHCCALDRSRSRSPRHRLRPWAQRASVARPCDGFSCMRTSMIAWYETLRFTRRKGRRPPRCSNTRWSAYRPACFRECSRHRRGAPGLAATCTAESASTDHRRKMPIMCVPLSAKCRSTRARVARNLCAYIYVMRYANSTRQLRCTTPSVPASFIHLHPRHAARRRDYVNDGFGLRIANINIGPFRERRSAAPWR